MTVRLDVNPAVLQWAVERSGRPENELWNKSNPRADYDAWLSGSKKPTYKQLQKFAQRTYVPFGYLLLEHPVDEPEPIADFRLVADGAAAHFSANLLDTIYSCQSRLDWWMSHRKFNGDPPPSIGQTATTSDDPRSAAERMRAALDWNQDVRGAAGSLDRALAELRDRIESLGVLVVIASTVPKNSRRSLLVNEFRGFALIEDGYALVFVNGRDAKSAQMFTLAHEVAHVMLGEQGVSDIASQSVRDIVVERWCNAVAAEFLMPESEFRQLVEATGYRRETLETLAKHFRVSGEALLYRFRELGYIDWDFCRSEVAAERARIAAILADKPPGRGNFYNSAPVQLSKRFTQELIGDALEGRTPYTQAFDLLGIRKAETFDALAEKLGIT